MLGLLKIESKNNFFHSKYFPGQSEISKAMFDKASNLVRMKFGFNYSNCEKISVEIMASAIDPPGRHHFIATFETQFEI